MPETYTLIASNTLSSSAASVTFSSIDATYTDLILRWTARSTNAVVNDGGYVQLNETTYTTTNYSQSVLQWYGTTQSGYNQLTPIYFVLPGASATSNTFGSSELYLANYRASTAKQSGVFTVAESNTASVYSHYAANLKNNTTAISSITALMTSGSFDSGSSFFLYGIKNS